MNRILVALATSAVALSPPSMTPAVMGAIPMPVYNTATYNLTNACPSLATAGLDLANVQAYHVIVSASSGQTLSGAGTMQPCFYSTQLARWMPGNPGLAFGVTVGGNRDFMSADYLSAVGIGRVAYVPNGITVSSGTTVVVTIEAVGR